MHVLPVAVCMASDAKLNSKVILYVRIKMSPHSA